VFIMTHCVFGLGSAPDRLSCTQRGQYETARERRNL
jgi:hypothetical protein